MKSLPLPLKEWERQAYVERATIQWALFGDRSMKRWPGAPKKGEKDSNWEEGQDDFSQRSLNWFFMDESISLSRVNRQGEQPEQR